MADNTHLYHRPSFIKDFFLGGLSSMISNWTINPAFALTLAATRPSVTKLGLSAVPSSLTIGLAFAAKDQFRHFIGPRVGNTEKSLLAGAFAGATTVVFTYPWFMTKNALMDFATIAAEQMHQPGGPPSQITIEATKIRPYAGATPMFLRMSTFYALYFGLYDSFRPPQPQPFLSTVSLAFSTTLATQLATAPLTTTVNRFYSFKHNPSHEPLLTVARDMLQREGPAAFLGSFTTLAYRTVLWGSILVMYEKFHGR